MTGRARELSSTAPARLPTARSGPFYGMVLFTLVLAVVTGTLVFSYGYLAVNADQWATSEVGPPSATLCILATIVVLVAAVVIGLAQSSVAHDGPVTPAVSGLVATGGLALGAGGLLVWALVDLPYGADTNAFAAATWLLTAVACGFALLTAAAGLLVALWLVRGHEGNVSAVESVAVVRVLTWFTAIATPVVLGTVGVGGGWW